MGKLKYFKITDKSPYFILEMYKIDKNVFSFIKITGNIKLDNIIIPEEIRPSVNKSVALHDTNSVNTVTLRFQTDGKVLIVNNEPINLPLCMNMIVWDTN